MMQSPEAGPRPGVIVLGNMITNFGNSLYVVGLFIFIARDYPNPLFLGMIQAAAYLPVVLFSFQGGIRADRENRIRIISGSDILRGAGFFAAALLFFSRVSIHPMLILIPMVLFNAFMQARFTPAVMSYLLDINLNRKKREKQSAIMQKGLDWFSLRTAVTHLASLAGQGAGAVLSGFLGMSWLLVISGAGFLFSGFWERTSADAPKSAGDSAHGVGDENFSLRGVMGHIRRLHAFHRLGVPVYLYLGIQGVNSMLVINMPFFLLRRLGAPEMFLGLAMAALFGGSLLYAAADSLLLSKVSWCRGNAGLFGLLYAGFLLLMSMVPGGYLEGSGMMFRGLLPLLILLICGALLSAVYLRTLRELHAQSAGQGSGGYLGLLEAMGTAVLPVSYLVNSAIAGLLPLDTPWLLRSASAVLFTGIMIMILVKRYSGSEAP